MKETHAEVMRVGAGVPRVQLRLVDWLNRTPGNAERLVIEAPDQVILDLDVVEALQRGPERLAEQIYLSASEVAHARDRETQFSCTWYKSDAQGEPAIALHTLIRLGSNHRDGDHYDGSAVSIISQLQAHQERMLNTFMGAIASITGGQSNVISDLTAALSSAQAQNEKLARDNAELLAVNAELEADSESDDGTDQLVKMGMEAIAQQIKSGGKPPKQ